MTEVALSLPSDSSQSQSQVSAPNKTRVEILQARAREFVGLVAEGTLPGMALIGPGGMGKSHCAAEALSERGVKPLVFNSHVSPLSLYQLLYHHRAERVVILEDLEHVFHNTAILGLLRSALWGPLDKSGRMLRTVNWNSTAAALEVPTSFTLECGLVLMANAFPTTAYFQALLTRIPTVDFGQITRDELYDFMAAVVGDGQQVFNEATKSSVFVPRSDCVLVIDFLRKHDVTDLRVLQIALKLFARFDGKEIWKELLSETLRHNASSQGSASGQLISPPPFSKRISAKRSARLQSSVIEVLQKIMEKPDLTVKEQERLFIEETKLSRATFYRVRAALARSSDPLAPETGAPADKPMIS